MRALSSTGWTSGAATYDSGFETHNLDRPAPRCSALLSGLVEVIPHLVPSPVAFSTSQPPRRFRVHSKLPKPRDLQHNHARYDNNGNVTGRLSGSGVQASYSYDPLNRLTAVSYNNGTPGVSYSYDPPIPNGYGRLGSIGNASAVMSYSGFDVLGNVTASSEQIAGQTYSFGYSYNLAGALTSETYPSGRVLTTSYDGANRGSELQGKFAGVSSIYMGWIGYAPHGGIGLMALGNNLWRAYSYNSRLQLSELQDVINNDSTRTLLRQTFTWDTGTSGHSNNNGNLQGVTTLHSGAGLPQPLTFNDSFGYDNLNRLAWGNGKDGSNNLVWAQNFGYDSFGNRWISSSGGTPVYGNTPTSNVYNGNNQISGSSYDGAGNQTTVNGNTVAYDGENRVASVTSPPNMGGGTETLGYDGLGERVLKAMPGGTNVYVYL